MWCWSSFSGVTNSRHRTCDLSTTSKSHQILTVRPRLCQHATNIPPTGRQWSSCNCPQGLVRMPAGVAIQNFRPLPAAMQVFLWIKGSIRNSFTTAHVSTLGVRVNKADWQHSAHAKMNGHVPFAQSSLTVTVARFLFSL